MRSKPSLENLIQNREDQVMAPYNHGELYNLRIRNGTINKQEREKINEHIVVTIEMLKALPFPKELSNVVEYAGSHHERIDGKYPFALEKRAVCTRVRNTERAMADLTAVRDEMDVLNGFVEYTIGRAPDERETAVLRQVVEQVRAERTEHTGATQQHGIDGDDGFDRGEVGRNTTGDLTLFDDDAAEKE